MKVSAYGKMVRKSRVEKGLTQSELAAKCNIGLRTVQRIESGAVSPRSYTVMVLNAFLGLKWDRYGFEDKSESDERLLKRYRLRRKIRLVLFVTVIIILCIVGLHLVFSPGGKLFGLPKATWAPFVYTIVFLHLIGIGVYWRCPACEALLGDVFNQHYCAKCGFQFKDTPIKS
jgi:transcriptional regulator with XRE-family HTH domain